jgi:L,D-peptidoglycan transpeptidase YkuD (ErfK/YbiS/YcfS/YnhG family)
MLLLLLLLVSSTGCGKEEVIISMNHDTFNNQNAASKDNKVLDSSDVLIEETKATPPTVTTLPEESSKEALEALEESFDEVEETVYATANVKIRSHYTTKANNVIDILEAGGAIKRIGIGKEWSKVEFNHSTYYIMSAYLTTKEPTPTVTITPTPKPEEKPTKAPDADTKASVPPAPTDLPEASAMEDSETEITGDYSFVETLSTLKDLDKLVCVIGSGGSECTVSFHKKDKKGQWIQIFSIDGDCGLDGITFHKREGDNKTPAGLYSFTLAFGLKSDPGAFLDYRKITEFDYWIDDVNNPHYNTWVNANDTPGDYSSEHLIDHNPSYNYALNINYNADCTPGLGSAVFLHCYNEIGFTTGCIAISENYMKTLVKEADSATRIIIVPKEEDLSKY